ncbi:MAG: PIN domain-containing protein [Mucilaginibacter sp.]|uniref:PIN domain-containing protein n=1 Tax=Mucilaginibacter sp. TaxID=1882438 RepID=UPI0034E433DD
MNGIKFLVDTNCFIYLLNENPLIVSFAQEEWAFSYITEIELLSKKNLSNDEDFLIRKMLSICYKVDHNQQLSDLAIILKRANNIKLPDAIIAASAQLLQLPLLTADKGFANIKSIDCMLLNM